MSVYKKHLNSSVLSYFLCLMHHFYYCNLISVSCTCFWSSQCHAIATHVPCFESATFAPLMPVLYSPCKMARKTSLRIVSRLLKGLAQLDPWAVEVNWEDNVGDCQCGHKYCLYHGSDGNKHQNKCFSTLKIHIIGWSPHIKLIVPQGWLSWIH